ncbi:ATP-binding protein [Methanolobus sp. WCC5]|uniref:sensor histidine kinase n=1 Tax=Methanolobus sp. WCC5 TaxID=3125785 RepID=UPI003246B51F
MSSDSFFQGISAPALSTGSYVYIFILFLVMPFVFILLQKNSKKTEYIPREIEPLLRHIVEFSPLPMALLDTASNIVHLNRKFTETFGYTLENVPSLRELWGDSGPVPANPIKESDFINPGYSFPETDETAFSNERAVLCKDGSSRDTECSLAKITDDRIILVFKDMTKVKTAEKALLLDELRLEALFELNQLKGSTVNDVLDFSLKKAVELTESQIGCIGFVNEDGGTVKIPALSTRSMELCCIKDVNSVFHIGEMGFWAEPIRQHMSLVINDCENTISTDNRFLEGCVHTRNYLGIPIFDNDKIVMVAGVANKTGDYDSSDIRQITLLMEATWELIKRKEDEDKIRTYAQELAKNNRELESLDRMKDEFMANITHELKTPLIPIKGYSELLFEGHLGSLDEDQRRSVGVILQNADRLHKLIDSLLYMQNIHSGNVQYHLDSIDVASILEKVTGNIVSLRKENGPSLIKEYTSPLPFICGNRVYLEQVFFHIIENSFKFTPPEGSVTVNAYQERRMIHIIVKDTGIGIPEAELQNVFKRFYQADGSLTRRYGGNGLGLYLCKSIVEAHGGSIWAVSEKGRGTELHVLLPIIEEGKI